MNKLFLVLITIAQLSTAQTSETTSSTPKERKIALGVSFSPDYSYRSIKATNAYGSDIIAHLEDSMELPIFAFTSGVKLSTLLRNRFTFETGILYSQKGFRQKPFEFNPNVYDPAVPKTSAYHVAYSSIDVPVKVNFYPIKTAKGGLFVSAGVINNLFFVKTSTYTYVYANNQTKKQTNKYSGLIYSPSLLVTLGYEQSISKRLFFKAEPSYRRQLVDLSERSSFIKTYFYSFGLDISLFLKL